MSENLTKNIRNIGIIAHIDAGKTSLTERILYYTKKIDYMGEVHNGTATMDYLPEEQERGITISSACTTCSWNDYLLNIVDTPGHVDFTIEVERSLRVLDGVVAVFCALSGVQAQSEYVWKQSEKFAIPKIVFINKIDRIGADFQNTVQEIRTRLKANAHALTLPYTDKEGRECILDLLCEKKLYFNEEDKGETVFELALDNEEKLFLQEKREEMLTFLAESDEMFFELFLSNNFNEVDVYSAIKRAVAARSFIPVYAGSAFMNRGIQPLLDGIVAFLPSPLEKKVIARNPKTGVETEICAKNEDELCALLFKVLLEEEEKISFLRLYSGTLAQGETIYNVEKNVYEKVEEIFKFHAYKLENVEKAFAGEVVGVLGLEHGRTASTYTKKSELILDEIQLPSAVLSMLLEARNQEESLILSKAMQRYAMEDPTLNVVLDEGTGQFQVSGMGELHIEVLCEKLQREYNISPRLGQVQVIFKEILCNEVLGHAEFEREIEGKRHALDVTLKLSPHKSKEGKNLIRFSCNTQNINPKHLDMIAEIIESGLSVSANGYETQDILAEVEKIEYPQGELSEIALQIAVNMALREALEKACFEKIKPIMKLEIQVPEEYLGKCLLALTQVQAKVDNLLESSSTIKKVQARAFLSQLFGFATHLRSLTQGRAELMMQFDSFSKDL